MPTVTYKPGADGVALLSLAGDGQGAVLLNDLSDAVAQLVADETQTGAILVVRETDGTNLREKLALSESEISPVALSDRLREQAAVLRRLETCGKPVVAALIGSALGSDLELALACHHRIALEAPNLCMGIPDIELGLLPSLGGTQRLPRIVGIEAAVPLLLEGRLLSVRDALSEGLLDATAGDEDALMAAARAWIAALPDPVKPWDMRGYRLPDGAGPLASFAAQTFQANSSRLKATRRCYPAPHALLSAVYEGTLVPFDRAMGIEADYAAGVLADPVAGNLIRSHLRQTEARAPKGGATSAAAVKKLAVLGAGMMGAGIANVAAAAGIDVVLLDRNMEAAQNGKAQAEKVRDRAVAKGALAQEAADAILSRITATDEYAKLAGADLIIEAVFENRAVKAEVSKQAWPKLADGGIFASNTSTLPITSLARNLPEPARFIGLHFFSPVERMPLVEIITGEATSGTTLERALAFVAKLGKTPIVVHDSPGFYTSRIFCTYIDEAMAMLAEGVAPALIENAARQAGFPVSPLAVTDEVSLDLQKLVIDQARADGLDEKFLRSHAAPVIEKLCDIGRFGRKSGAGFHDFAEDGSKRLWPGLSELFPQRKDQPTAEDVGKRLLYIQSLESMRCLEEGVIDDPATADIGSVLGIGFPPWTGGALSLVTTVGAAAFTADCRRFAGEVGNRFLPLGLPIGTPRTADT